MRQNFLGGHVISVCQSMIGRQNDNMRMIPQHHLSGRRRFGWPPHNRHINRIFLQSRDNLIAISNFEHHVNIGMIAFDFSHQLRRKIFPSADHTQHNSARQAFAQRVNFAYRHHQSLIGLALRAQQSIAL